MMPPISNPSNPDPADSDTSGALIFRKVARRLLPFMGLLYVIAFLDRVNVGFAATEMNTDLGFTPEVFGNGAGLFFVGYVLFGIPSNLLLHRVGARRWISITTMLWGLLSGAMAFIRTPTEFFLLRFLVGLAEAGFFPGMILYLTYWFPKDEQNRAFRAFLVALPLSSAIGAPVSGLILAHQHWNLRGWQWLFLMEALPAVLAGALALKYLTDRPQTATWLSASERQFIIRRLAGSNTSSANTVIEGLSGSTIWVLSLTYFCLLAALYGYNFWLPLIVQGFGDYTYPEMGALVMVPNLTAAVVLWFSARRSTSSRELLRYLTAALLMGALGLLASAVVHHSAGVIAGLTFAAIGIYSALPYFWALPTAYLSGVSAAAGIALVNSIGNMGGFVGASMMGYLKQQTGSYTGGLMLLSAFAAVAALVAWSLYIGPERRRCLLR